MAVLKGGGPARRGPSYGGRLIFDTYRGAWRARAWPRPRKRRRTKKERHREELFALASTLTKYTFPQQQILAREITKGTPLMPRDLQVAAMFGRLFAITFPDGRTLYPMAARHDVSDSLDVLGQVPGGILIRGEALWEILTPGPAGQVLTSQGPGLPPRWSTATGTSAGGGCTSLIPNANYADPAATQGNVFSPLFPMQIPRAWAYLSMQAGERVKFSIIELDESTVTAVIAQTPAVVLTITGKQQVGADFTATPLLHPAKKYALVYTALDREPNATLTRFYSSGLGTGWMPAAHPHGECALATNNPTVGDTTIFQDTKNPTCCNFQYILG